MAGNFLVKVDPDRHGSSRLEPISKGKGKVNECKMPTHIWSNNIQRIEKVDMDVDKRTGSKSGDDVA